MRIYLVDEYIINNLQRSVILNQNISFYFCHEILQKVAFEFLFGNNNAPFKCIFSFLFVISSFHSPFFQR